MEWAAEAGGADAGVGHIGAAALQLRSEDVARGLAALHVLTHRRPARRARRRARRQDLEKHGERVPVNQSLQSTHNPLNTVLHALAQANLPNQIARQKN